MYIRTLSLKKEIEECWVCLWPAQNCVLQVHNVSMTVHRFPDLKPTPLKTSEKWILHILSKGIREKAEESENEMKKFSKENSYK